MPDFESLQKKLHIHFKDSELLERAFTHRSYLNEHRNIKKKHNERLEFLGDAVLELAVTEYLFDKYPQEPEGVLTALRAALVNTQTISDAARTLEFNKYLLLSRGEAKDTGRARQYILANTFESFIGALYLDQGYDAARTFIEAHIFPLSEKVLEEGLWRDAKSWFQEQAQEHVSITPRYETIKEKGPDHDKTFEIAVYLEDEEVARGHGQSKQEAEQHAAREALSVKGWNK